MNPSVYTAKPLDISDVKRLRSNWAAAKERRAISDEDWLFLISQDPAVLDALNIDYDSGTSPYKVHNGNVAKRSQAHNDPQAFPSQDNQK